VAEGIDLPTDSRSDSELFKCELVAHLHVVDHVLVVGASFIMHRPASVKNLETALADKVSDVLLHCLSLVSPPHLEEFHLNIRESLLVIFNEHRHNLIKDEHHLDTLDIIFHARVILINSF
jgi:hypothetical protein